MNTTDNIRKYMNLMESAFAEDFEETNDMPNEGEEETIHHEEQIGDSTVKVCGCDKDGEECFKVCIEGPNGHFEETLSKEEAESLLNGLEKALSSDSEESEDMDS